MSELERYFTLEYVLPNNERWKQMESYNFFDEDCPICMDSLYGKCVYELPCGHVYHIKCIYSYIFQIKKVKCPSCMIAK